MPEPWFSSTVDGMAPVGGVSVNNAGVSLPLSSERGTDSTLINTGAISPVLPVRNAGWAGGTIRKTNGTNSRPALTLLGAGGANRIRVQLVNPAVANDDYVAQYWDGAAWVTMGAVFPLGTDVNQIRIEWSGYGTSSGSIYVRVFKDGAEILVAERSASGLNFTSLTGIVQLSVGTVASGASTSIFSALFVMDADGNSSYVYTDVANANGVDAGGTGTFSSINTTGSAYDSTFISLPTSGLRRSVKNTANRSYDGRTIRALSVNARLRRGSTGPSQARVYLIIGGVRYYHPTTLSLTISFESYCMVWETDPSTGVAWTITAAEASSLEWGVEAV